MARTLPSIDETAAAVRADQLRGGALRQAEIERAAGIQTKVAGGDAVAPQTVQNAAGATLTTETGSTDAAKLASIGYKPVTTGAGAAGTTGAGATGAVPLTPDQQAAKFSDLMNKVTKDGAATAKESYYGDLSTNFDNQLLVQRGLLYAALAGDRLTPENLRVLSPAQQAAIRSGQANDIKQQVAAMNSILQGRTDIRKEEATKAEKQFNLYLDSGTAPEDVDTAFLAKLDEAAGTPSGTYAAVYRAKYETNEKAKQEAEIDAASKVVNILDKIPVGQEIEIAGNTYTGFSTSGVKSGMEIDKNGDGTYWEYDAVNKTFNTISVGSIGSGEGWERRESSDGVVYYENKNTGARKLVQNGSDPNGGTSSGLVAAFPDRSVTPFDREGRGDIAGTSYKETSKWWAAQCGAVVNDWTGLKLGDSYQDKLSKMDSSITSDNTQVGDVFVVPYGSTGHTGVINSIYELDGEKYYRVSESNWYKGEDGIGLITHSRSIKASTVTGYARPGFKDPSYSFGTDVGNIDVYALDNTGSDIPVEDVTALRSKFVSEAGTFEDVRDAYSRVKVAAENDSAAGDLALIFGYMKLLDPSSTVREGEQASAQNAAGIPDQIKNQYNKIVSGERLNPNQRQDFLNQAKLQYQVQYETFKPILDVYINEAEQLGVDPSRVIGTVYVPEEPTPTTQASSSATTATEDISSFFNRFFSTK